MLYFIKDFCLIKQYEIHWKAIIQESGHNIIWFNEVCVNWVTYIETMLTFWKGLIFFKARDQYIIYDAVKDLAYNRSKTYRVINTDLVLSFFLENGLGVDMLLATWEHFRSEWHPKYHCYWLSNFFTCFLWHLVLTKWLIAIKNSVSLLVCLSVLVLRVWALPDKLG